jgi:sec-independent protein translocase protein TatB
MTIFGIGPFELLLIVILGLIVFGPERLPEIGRFIGRTVARVLAWQHQSPEAQMIQQLRRELDQEIIELRDEIIRARQQLDISTEANKIHQETRSLLQGSLQAPGASTTTLSSAASAQENPPTAGKPKPAAAAQTNGVAQNDPSLEKPAGVARSEREVIAAQTQPTVADDLVSPAKPGAAPLEQSGQAANPDTVASGTGTSSETNVSISGDTVVTELEALTLQLQHLTADVQALREQLQAQGLLDQNRQPLQQASHQEITPS